MKTFRRETIGIYILLILFGVPLLVNLKYQDIIQVKSTFYLVVTGIFYAIVAIAIIGKYLIDRKMGIEMRTPKEVAKSFDPLDWSLIAFGILILLSAITSRFPKKDVFFGTRAQLTGALMLLFLVISYFIISRGAEAAKKSYAFAFYASSLAVEVFGLLNRLRIDPLEMHKENVLDTFTFMTSTVGNVDYFYAFTSIIILFFAAYRADMEWDVRGFAVDALLIICYMNFWTTRAGGILAAFSYGLPALLLISLTSYTRFRNLFWQGTLQGLAVLICTVIRQKYVAWDIFWGTDTIVMGFYDKKLWIILGIVCAVIWFLLGNIKKNKKEDEFIKNISVIKLPVIALSCVSMAIFEGLILFYRPMQDITGRTFIWDDLKIAFQMSSIREKLLGVGPGCMDNTLIDLGIHTPEQSYFLTAHNEVFEYWFLCGIIGAVVYVVFMASFFYNFYRNVLSPEEAAMPHYRDMLCCGVLFATYLGQGLTNGPYVINIVVGFTFLALYRRFQIPDEE